MKQKVIKIGSSAGVTISKKSLEDLGIQVGDTVETHSSTGVFTIKPSAPQVKPAEKFIELAKRAEKDAQFAAWLDKTIEQYRPALEALRDK